MGLDGTPNILFLSNLPGNHFSFFTESLLHLFYIFFRLRFFEQPSLVKQFRAYEMGILEVQGSLWWGASFHFYWVFRTMGLNIRWLTPGLVQLKNGSVTFHM